MSESAGKSEPWDCVGRHETNRLELIDPWSQVGPHWAFAHSISPVDDGALWYPYFLHGYAHSRHKTVYSSTPAWPCPAPPPDRAAERRNSPQTHSYLRPGWLWENHFGQRMDRRLQASSSLA